MPTWSVAPSGMRSTMARRSPVALVGRRGDLDERALGLAAAEHLGGVDLVEAEGPRHPRVDLEEERDVPDERGDVVGVGAEAEVPVAVGGVPRRSRPSSACRAQQRGISEKWLGTRSSPAQYASRVAGAGSRRRGAGASRRAVQVAPLVQRVHLVHAHVLEAVGVASSASSEGDRLAVGQGTMTSAPGGTCSSTSSAGRAPAGGTAEGTPGSLVRRPGGTARWTGCEARGDRAGDQEEGRSTTGAASSRGADRAGAPARARGPRLPCRPRPRAHAWIRALPHRALDPVDLVAVEAIRQHR